MGEIQNFVTQAVWFSGVRAPCGAEPGKADARGTTVTDEPVSPSGSSHESSVARFYSFFVLKHGRKDVFLDHLGQKAFRFVIEVSGI
ncbi:MAG: hypothetical protein GTO29_14535 [Candidatus Latescibacteria bacterium]|nr:hypothetical protein [Candidatus Latescibacterota bacterium]NIO57367.1 hypothetical protein [Candidatus Latescibacterota bacterium]